MHRSKLSSENRDWKSLEAFSFGDSPRMADELLELVLIGRKRATCWAASQDVESSYVGELAVVLNGSGVPKAVNKTTELTKRRFNEVNAAFALRRVLLRRNHRCSRHRP